MREQLHDALDEMESAREASDKLVAGVRARAVEVIEEAGDFDDGMTALALLLENELADLTTTTVRRFLGMGRALAKNGNLR